jgi:DNA end-binding protein Ku
MAQAVWTGRLSFGLVSIPVKLYSATSPKRVQFHHYDARSGRRIQYRRSPTGPALEHPEPSSEELHATSSPDRTEQEPRPPERSFASQEGSRAQEASDEAYADTDEEPEVPWEEVVKGFEIEPGKVVTVTPDELASVAPQRSDTLEVEQFVSLDAIDPVYFDKSYYLAPQPGEGTGRPYQLLLRAMRTSGQVAIGRFVMRTKEYLAAVRPGGDLLMLETLFFADEVRDSRDVWTASPEDPPEREMQMAQQLIEALAGSWDPSRHRDEHRDRVLDLLRSKGAAAPVLSEPEYEAAAPVTDLIETLKASVEAAKQARRTVEEHRDSAERRDAG